MILHNRLINYCMGSVSIFTLAANLHRPWLKMEPCCPLITLILSLASLIICLTNDHLVLLICQCCIVVFRYRPLPACQANEENLISPEPTSDGLFPFLSLWGKPTLCGWPFVYFYFQRQTTVTWLLDPLVLQCVLCYMAVFFSAVFSCP